MFYLSAAKRLVLALALAGLLWVAKSLATSLPVVAHDYASEPKHVHAQGDHDEHDEHEHKHGHGHSDKH